MLKNSSSRSCCLREREMAFAAVISAMRTVERLMNSSRILLSPPSQRITESAYEELKSLKETLKKLDGSCSCKAVNALDARIREAVSQLEDLLESSLLDQATMTDPRSDCDFFSIDLQHLAQDVDFFVESTKKMEEEYDRELGKPLPEEEEGEDCDTTVPDFGEKKRSKMVGLSEELSKMKDFLTNYSDAQHYVVSIVEMAGIGKTAFAMELFEDPLIVSHFQRRAWVHVGRKYQPDAVARQLLVQVDPDTNFSLLEGDPDKVRFNLHARLKDEKYLIVLDDVWDTQVWDYLGCCLPYSPGRSRVIVTSRLKEVARHIYGAAYFNHKTIRLLSVDEGWRLLCREVFGEDTSCPRELRKPGKKIAENCFGLPLVIIAAAQLLLSKVEQTAESWSKVAEEKDFVFTDNEAYEKISKVLMPSYDYLPQYLKPCFLLMGVIPQMHEIRMFMFRDLWVLEGFLEPNTSQTLKDCSREYLATLASNSLVIPFDSNETYPPTEKAIKSCLLHTCLWHLSKREAGRNKFFHILNTVADGLDEGLTSQRRLSVHNNLLFGSKEVRNSIEEKCASTARSLQCYGRFHQYQVPMCWGLRLLRILDVRRIRFYKFPIEVLGLIQLRYFSLTFNGQLPPGISKLWNLEFLIIHRHGSRSGGDEPVEMWDMQEMKHLRIMGSRLPDPSSNTGSGKSLKNLLTLLGVNAGICTKRILKRIPRLKKLGIRIELAHSQKDGSGRPFHGLNRISRLRRLESLECVVVNPEVRPGIAAPPAPRSMFPASLRKLRLNGLGYPWEHMNIIGSLPNLENLKLRCYAFHGPKCEIQRSKFLKLKFLSIEDTDLVEMSIAGGSLPELSTLSFRHCYKVERVRWESGIYLGKIEAELCNPMMEKCIMELKETREKRNASLRLPPTASSMPVVDAQGNVRMISYFIDQQGNFRILFIVNQEEAAALGVNLNPSTQRP